MTDSESRDQVILTSLKLDYIIDTLNSMFDAEEEYGCGFYDHAPWTLKYDELRRMTGRVDRFNHE